MTDQLRDLLRDEAERIEVPRPPIAAILTDGRQRNRVRRAQGLIALAASVVLIVGGAVGVNRFLLDDARDPSPDVATSSPNPSLPNPNLPSADSSSPSATATQAGSGSLDLSGASVGTQAFGTPADEVVAAVTADLGKEPDLVLGPQRYSRIAGQNGWFDDAGDPLSLSWEYPTVSVTCWGQLCLMFGGDNADMLRLRGWELAEQRRWSGYDKVAELQSRDIRLAGTGIGLGDNWKRLQSAYPGTVASGGEGASLVVENTPWPGVFDGVGEWRLSGQWDFARPNYAPPGSKVTRLSGGEGPEPGCC